MSCEERETIVDAKPKSAPKSAIVGPDGYLMSIRDLPPPDTTRWVARRKAIVVFAVAGGLISTVEACKRYGLTLEELEGWKRLVQNHGVRGLRVTRAKYYRALGQSR
jgi:hypothetical protein